MKNLWAGLGPELDPEIREEIHRLRRENRPQGYAELDEMADRFAEFAEEYARQRALENEQLIRDTIRALAEAIAADGACFWHGAIDLKIIGCGKGKGNPDAVEAHLLALLKTEE